MGCDIHLYAERRDENGTWVDANPWEVNKYHESDPEHEPRMTIPYGKGFYSGRNYDLFGILANVRNGRGFAGCDLGRGYWPISPPRGLPDDVSPEVLAESELWDDDGHSHSWLTVAELMAYDWTQTTVSRGWVSLKEFADWNRWARSHGEPPASYCGDVFGPNIRKVSIEEMERLCAEGVTEREVPDPKRISYYCQVEWTHPYYSVATEFLSATLPRLWRLGAPEDVRIVFWFDN